MTAIKAGRYFVGRCCRPSKSGRVSEVSTNDDQRTLSIMTGHVSRALLNFMRILLSTQKRTKM